MTAAAHALGRAAQLELGSYREDHVAQRVEVALRRERVTSVALLARLLAHDAAARDRFRRSVAISHTGLFRDPEQFDLLARELLPPLLAGDRRIGVWSAGCADGSELYSVAMLLERAGALERSVLLGSDLLDENVARARRGEYDGVPVAPHLRLRARWERRDLLRDGAPPGRWRLVLCRNVGIYLTRSAKDELHRTLASALAPHGVLLLGRSERIADPARLGLAYAAPHAYRRLP